MLKAFIIFVLFMIKAVCYGIGLCFGFYLVGKITGYFDYYMGLYLHDKPTFYEELGRFLPKPITKPQELVT